LGRRFQHWRLVTDFLLSCSEDGVDHFVGESQSLLVIWYMQVHEFVPLVQFGCSPLLKFFLCSLYAPMCTVQVDEAMVIPACRSMCLEVRRRCEPVLLRFNFRWPAVLDCSQLPEQSDRSNLCIDPPPDVDGKHAEMEHFGGVGGGGGAVGTGLPYNPEWAKLLDAFRGDGRVNGKRATPPPPLLSSSADAAGGRRRCPERFVATTSPNDSSPPICAVRCGIDVLFRQSDKDFMATWMTVWASLCLASSLFAVVTYAVDTSRFDYPQRPVVFLAACCAFQSVAYLLRAAVGPETVSCDASSDTGNPLYIIREGLESVCCMAVSLVLYFFGMASATWWVGLAVAWYLASARRWGREAIQACAGYFHLVAWTLPAVQTIVALALRRVDGDELSGLCHIGNQDSTALAVFVVAPTAFYLLVGAAFIVVGFLSLRSIRRDLKHHQNQQQQLQAAASLMSGCGGGSNGDVHKLEKLMAKIGLFSVLYVVLTSALLASLFYQLLHVDMWLTVAREPCQSLPRHQFDYRKVNPFCHFLLCVCLTICYMQCAPFPLAASVSWCWL